MCNNGIHYTCVYEVRLSDKLTLLVAIYHFSIRLSYCKHTSSRPWSPCVHGVWEPYNLSAFLCYECNEPIYLPTLYDTDVRHSSQILCETVSYDCHYCTCANI